MPRFCAQYSRDVGEPLAGTGMHPRSNLLLSWPSVDWTRTFHQAKDMTGDESGLVTELVGSGRRVNLIHRKSQPRGWHRAFLMPENLAFDVPREELAAFLSALHAGDSLDAWLDGPVTRRVLLCCTHGVKDKCCAKFGNASYKALVSAAENMPGEFDIWQSTHLGGCRLASAALLFPAMHKYGRVEAGHAAPLLASEREDQPYLPCYRGDGALTPVQQVAEIEARGQLADEGRIPTHLEWVSEQALSDDRVSVGFAWHSDGERGEVTITLEKDSVSRFGTCADIDAGEAPAEQTVWRNTRTISTEAVQGFDPADRRLFSMTR